MSRIGRAAITLPDGVTITQSQGQIQVKGPKGSMATGLPDLITVEVEGGVARCVRADERKQTRALHGLARAIVANMVTGVTAGFAKELEIQGVGYRADFDGNKLKLALGFSHPVAMDIPEGLKVSVDKNTVVRIEGMSREAVGQFAADVRSLRPPEPYKGKGIRYVGEHVRRKVGKAGAA